MSPLTYSGHARRRMRQRGITEQDVAWALKRPCGNRPGQPGTMWVEGHAAGNRILAVCVKLEDRHYVVTAAWTRQEATP